MTVVSKYLHYVSLASHNALIFPMVIAMQSNFCLPYQWFLCFFLVIQYLEIFHKLMAFECCICPGYRFGSVALRAPGIMGPPPVGLPPNSGFLQHRFPRFAGPPPGSPMDMPPPGMPPLPAGGTVQLPVPSTDVFVELLYFMNVDRGWLS